MDSQGGLTRGIPPLTPMIKLGYRPDATAQLGSLSDYELNNTLIIVLNITRKNNKYIFRSKNIVETGIRKVKKISKKSMYFFVFEIKKKFQIFPARKSRNS